MSARNGILRNTLFSSAGIYVEYFLGMVAAILVARHLGPTDYGVYGLFMWFVTMGIVVTNAGVTTGVIKFVAELRGAAAEGQIRAMIRHLRRSQLWHLMVVFAAAAVLYAVLWLRSSRQISGIEFALLLVAMGMRTFYMFNISVAKGFEAFHATAKVAWVAAPVNLALVIAAALLEGTILWFIVVYAISSVVFLWISAHEVRRLTRGLPADGVLTPELRARASHHLRFVSVTVVIGFLVSSDIEILFLNMYASAEAAGFFKVAYQLATGFALLVPGVFSALLLPMTARALAQGAGVARRRFVNMTSYLALLAAPVIVFGLCLADATITLLFGHAYAAAAPVFALVALASSIGFVAQGATSLLVGADRQRTIMFLTIAFGILKIGLDIALIMHFGLMGATAALTISSLVGSFVYLWLGTRVSGASLDWARLLRIGMAGACAALATVPVLRLGLAPLWTLALGGTIMAVAYAFGTLLLRCWDRDALSQFADLHQRLVGGHPRIVARLLAWAGTRAEGRG